MSYKGIPFTVVLAVLVAFFAYRRACRTVGRQRLAPIRFVLRASLLVLAGCVLFVPLLEAFDLLDLGEVFVGLAAGIALGFYGLRLTRFEVGGTPSTTCPTPTSEWSSSPS